MLMRFMLDYVMFVLSVVTCMVGWIEIEIEIFLIVIPNNFIKTILMCFTTVLYWTVYTNYYFITLCG